MSATALFAIPGWMDIPAKNQELRIEATLDGALIFDAYYQAKEDPMVIITWEVRAGDNRTVYLADTDGDSVITINAENNMRVYRIVTESDTLREGASYLHVFINGKRSSIHSVWCNIL